MFDKNFCGGTTMSSRDIMNYVVVCGNLQAIIAVLECIPPITTHNKAMPSLSYRV